MFENVFSTLGPFGEPGLLRQGLAAYGAVKYSKDKDKKWLLAVAPEAIGPGGLGQSILPGLFGQSRGQGAS